MVETTTVLPPTRRRPFSQLGQVRREIASQLGPAVLDSLHRRCPAIEGLAVVVPLVALGALAWSLGRLPLGAAWVGLLLLQGFVLHLFGCLAHSTYHQRIGGRRLFYPLSVIWNFAALLLPTAYAHGHADHHRFVGADEDETFTLDLDTRWKRLSFLTLPGQVLAVRGSFRRAHCLPRLPAPPGAFGPPPAALARRVRRERIALLGFAAATALAACFSATVRCGLVLPLVLVTPLLTGIRIIMEHAEADPRHRCHCATYYRTGPLTRLVFLWDGGDCHLVHHLFSGIPFYRMGRAVELMRPYLIGQGVRERRSFWSLLQAYYVRVEPHRTLWSRPER